MEELQQIKMDVFWGSPSLSPHSISLANKKRCGWSRVYCWQWFEERWCCACSVEDMITMKTWNAATWFIADKWRRQQSICLGRFFIPLRNFSPLRRKMKFWLEYSKEASTDTYYLLTIPLSQLKVMTTTPSVFFWVSDVTAFTNEP